MAMRPCEGVLDQLFIAPDAQRKGMGSMQLGSGRDVKRLLAKNGSCRQAGAPIH
jgi:hypothetical protein